MRLRLPLFLALLPLLFVTGCGAGKNQSPVAAEEEVGQVKSGLEAQTEKPTSYTAQKGDDLRKIAARPEIYGDAELWPLIQAANAEKLGQGSHVNLGTELVIPRDMSDDQLEEAREKARQIAAAEKPSRKRVPEPQAVAKAEKAPVAKASPPPAPAKPVPPVKKSGGLWSLLLILLMVLAALAAVLFYYSRKDARENG